MNDHRTDSEHAAAIPGEFRADPGLGVDDGELIDGFTLTELEDYVEAGREPRRSDIESSPDALRMVVGLEQVMALTRRAVDDADALPQPSIDWFDRIRGFLSREVRSGQALPLRHELAEDALTVDEAAVRSYLRAVVDGIEGVLTVRTHFVGEVTRLDAPVEVTVIISTAYGQPIQPRTRRVREEVSRVLSRHTDLNVVSLDIRVTDLHSSEGDGDE